MTKKTMLTAVHAELIPFMAERGFGFRKTTSGFIKTSPDVVHGLFVDVLTRDRKHYRITMSYHISFPRLEEAYVKHHLYMAQVKDVWTLAKNCDTLMAVDLASHLTMVAEDISTAIQNAKVGIDGAIIPFLDRYSNLDALVANLEDANYNVRVTSDPMSRAAILLSAHALASCRTGFESSAADLRKFCKTSQGAVHVTFAEKLIAGLEEDHFKECTTKPSSLPRVPL